MSDSEKNENQSSPALRRRRSALAWAVRRRALARLGESATPLLAPLGGGAGILLAFVLSYKGFHLSDLSVLLVLLAAILFSVPGVAVQAWFERRRKAGDQEVNREKTRLSSLRNKLVGAKSDAGAEQGLSIAEPATSDGAVSLDSDEAGQLETPSPIND